MRVVLDTNVLASGVLSRASVPGQLLLAWTSGMFALVVSEPILVELERTFTKPYFAHRRSAAERAAVLELLQREADVVPVTMVVRGIASHPEDDRILATALSGAADYLVSGDAALQALGSYRDVTIVSPRSFLEILP